MSPFFYKCSTLTIKIQRELTFFDDFVSKLNLIQSKQGAAV